MEITLEVPEPLGQALQPYQERLVGILERGLQSVVADGEGGYADENAILEMLVSQPDPAQVLAMQPSPELQARVNALLGLSKEKGLSAQQEAELNRYLLLEHLVRLAKAHAARNLRANP